jgi:pilus assembly protein Flp/PilA
LETARFEGWTVVMSRFVQRFLEDEAGATAIEYGLIAAMISVVVVAAMPILRDPILGAFGRVAGQLEAVSK